MNVLCNNHNSKIVRHPSAVDFCRDNNVHQTKNIICTYDNII